MLNKIVEDRHFQYHKLAIDDLVLKSDCSDFNKTSNNGIRMFSSEELRNISNSYVDALKFLKVEENTSEYESIDRLLRHLNRKSGSNGTKRSYLKRVHLFCVYLNMNPDEIVALPGNRLEEYVQTYADDYHSQDLSPAYVNNNVLAPLRTLFKQNGFKGNLALDIEGYYVPPRYRKTKEYSPEKNEIFLMADNSHSLKGRAIILVLYSSGLRASTLRALLYKDIKEELLSDRYTIKLPVYPGMKSIEPSACKNNIPYYSFICDEAAIALKLYLRERIEKNCSITDNEPLFASDFKMISKEDRKNKILCPRQLQDIVKIPAEKVIPVNGHFVSPRSLRKTFDSVLRAENVEGTHMDHKVQEFLVGHLLPGSQDHYFDRDKVEELRIEYSKLSFGRPSVGNKFKLLKQAIARAFQGTGLDADEVLKEYIEMKGRQ